MTCSQCKSHVVNVRDLMVARRDERSQWNLNAMLGRSGTPEVTQRVQRLVPGLLHTFLVSFPLDRSILDFAFTLSGRHLFEVDDVFHHPSVIVFGSGTERVVITF